MASTVCEVDFRAVRTSWWAASRVGLCLAKIRILAPVHDGAYISRVSTLSMAAYLPLAASCNAMAMSFPNPREPPPTTTSFFYSINSSWTITS
jgi:hypothetical protein